MGAADGYLTNPLYREIAAMLTNAGIPHRVDLGGRHWFVLFEINGREFRQVLHLGPANKRSTTRKTIARFRKIVAMRDRAMLGTAQSVVEITPPAPLPAPVAPTSAVGFPVSCLQTMDGEVRVRDLDIAERLGFDRPRKIRDLIVRNIGEITAFGICPTVGQNHDGGRGRPSTEYWLNEEQALLVATLSSAPNAAKVRAALISVFVAWRRGQLVPAIKTAVPDANQIGGIVKAVVNKALADRDTHLLERIDALSARVDDLAPSAPNLAVAVDYVPSIVVVAEMARIGNGQRYRALTSWVTGRLTKFCAARGYSVKWLPTYPGERAAFPRAAAEEWLRVGGSEEIRRRVFDHAASKQGQGVLPFVRGARQ